MDPCHGGPDWMKITPVAGFLFHEKEQSGIAVHWNASAYQNILELAEACVLDRKWFPINAGAASYSARFQQPARGRSVAYPSERGRPGCIAAVTSLRRPVFTS